MDKEELKKFLPDYLMEKGLDLRKGGVCPKCNGGHKTPCFHYDSDRNKVKCFSCDFNGDLFDVIQEYECVDYVEALRIAIERFEGHTPIKYRPDTRNAAERQTDSAELDLKACAANVGKTDYFHRRGLSNETISEFRLGFDVNRKNAVIPYPDEAYYFLRGTESEFKGKCRGQEPIFNLKDLYNSDCEPVFITEGQFDALSFVECGAYSIAIGGTNGINKLICQLKEKPTESPLIIATDADEAGQTAAERLKSELDALNMPSERFEMFRKDPNECLVSDRKRFESLIDSAVDSAKNLKNKEKESYMKSLSYIKNIIEKVSGSFGSERFEPFATGIEPLDKALQGGLLYGLCVIGAESSRGKSTLAMQIAENMSAAGNDVLYFSLEMSTADIVARGISRQDFLMNGDKAHSTMEILKGANVPEPIKKYTEIAGNIAIIENTSGLNAQNICDIARKHAEMTGKSPVVVVDYMQILQPIDSADALEKQKLDRAVTLFQNLGNELAVPVIGISSFNRSGYGKVEMSAFKESGGVEYTAEYCIGLGLTKESKIESEIRTEMKKQPREMSVYILKARRSGNVGAKVDLMYYSKYSHFEANDHGLKEWKNTRRTAI